MKGIITTAFLAVAIMVATAAQASPGPTSITFMERVEAQKDASSSTRNLSGETFLYSMVTFVRKLDTDVNGSAYYMNKFSVDDGNTASHIFGVSVTRTFTPKWKMDIGYSNSSNPKRNVIPSSDSDRFSFGLAYVYNPGAKARTRYDYKMTYSTGTDFSQGRTLSHKVGATDTLTKHWGWAANYTFVHGLQSKGTTVKREQYSNQYTADFTFKFNKKERVTVGYFFLQNLFHAVATSPTTIANDNTLLRLSYFYTM